MAKQTINVGSAANDGTGDPLRTAFTKSNDNFTELYAAGTATPPQGRLTLQTLTPVMITTQSAKTTIYYTPYVGNQVPIYSGTSIVMTTFAELSAATTDTTKSPAAIGASKVNDWFVWSDSGTIRLGHGPDWTSDTVRSAGTALTMVNGILLNNASITNGPAASRGTYVGTTRSNASSQLDWILGTAAANGGGATFYVWNAYNRVDVGTVVSDTSASWTLAATATRAAHNSTTFRVSWVCGLQEEMFKAWYFATSQADTGSCHNGVGLDTTSTFTGAFTRNSVAFQQAAVGMDQAAVFGAHFYSAIEGAQVSGTATFFGFVADTMRSGLNWTGRM